MQKNTVWPFVLIFILFITAAATAAGFTRARELTYPAPSVDRRVMPNGTVVELIDMDGELCLREFTANGQVAGYLRLPKSKQRDMLSAYYMVGIIGRKLYLHHYETSGDLQRRSENTVVAYDLDNGSWHTVAYAPDEEMDVCDFVYAADASPGGGLFLGYVNRTQGRITVWRMDVTTGAYAKAFVADTPFLLSAIAVSPTGGLYALAGDSIVYRLEGDSWTPVFLPAPGEAAAGLTAGGDGGVYLFLTTPDGPRVDVLTADMPYFHPFDLDARTFIKFHIRDAANWVAIDEHYHYVVSTYGERIMINQLTVPFWLLWDEKTLLLLIGSALAAAVMLTAVQYVIIKRKLSLLIKLMLAVFPVFTLGLVFLINSAQTSVSDTMEKDIRESLREYAEEAAENIDGEKFAQINWQDPYHDDYYPLLFDYMGELSQSRPLTTINGDQEETYYAYTSHWVYRVEGDRFYSAICDYLVVGLEVPYFENTAGIAARDTMLAARIPVYTYLHGIQSEMRWLAVLQPILNHGEVVGYLEIARPLITIDAAIDAVTLKIMTSGVLVFAGVLVILIFILSLSTRTLGKLKRGALAVSGGNYAARVVSHAWDETGEIAAAFNKMAESVENAVNDITAVSNGYSRFVSDTLIEVLGKQSVKDIQPGDHTALTATQILLFTDSFDTLQDKAFFAALERFYAAVVPHIAAGGGLISDCSARGFGATFEGRPETALHAVITLYAVLDRLADQTDCHVFLHYSGAVLGVTGNGGHLNMITVSRIAYESHAVGMAGKRFGARLMVSQSAYAVMGETVGGYRHRFLGVLRADGEIYNLYDFFDGDKPEIRLKKDAAKERFERGVHLYYAKEYADARRLFVDMIKEFPEDLASREYLRRSDAGQESGGEPLPLLELFAKGRDGWNPQSKT